MELELYERGCYIPKTDSLVISDLHIGRRQQFKPYPITNHNELRSKIDNLIKKFSPTTIFINGDVFQTFPPNEEDLSIINNIDNSIHINFVLGNHEEQVGGYHTSISDNYTVKNQYSLTLDNGSIAILHGHTIPEKIDPNILIIGHFHPMNNNNDCYMVCEVHGIKSIILPKLTKYGGGKSFKSIVKNHNHIKIDGVENLIETDSHKIICL